MALTQADAGLLSPTNAQYTGFKNRIINGAMVIDQRNAGASVTNTTSVIYTLDRWRIYGGAASKFTIQQNAGSVTPPAGFTKYAGITSTSAYTVGASEEFTFLQTIEGNNLADLSWGTANAKTVTFSFWVYSSLTGTFGGSCRNGVASRSYPFTYTINSANTWEQKSITIAGDTSGTWATDNSNGMYIGFGLGVGSTYSGTAGVWAGTNYSSATGATSVVGTNGATFYITGVQLEKGSTATSFDYRPYGTELALCQRYLYCANNVGATSSYSPFFPGVVVNSSPNGVVVQFPQQMRTQPSTTNSGNIRLTDMVNWSVAVTALDSSYLNSTGGMLYCTTGSSVITASGGAGRGLYLGADGTTAKVLFSAEL